MVFPVTERRTIATHLDDKAILVGAKLIGLCYSYSASGRAAIYCTIYPIASFLFVNYFQLIVDIISIDMHETDGSFSIDIFIDRLACIVVLF